MCGIAGIASVRRPVDRGALERMVDALAHRGPDDRGVELWRDVREAVSVGLGHTRLAIIDLSAAGHQPMANEDGSIRVVFNGEIFNAPELMEEQRARGHRFRSHSDTEAILHGYEDMGAEVPRALRGMFAFALLDRRDGSLLLVRDRLGKKPLYYHASGGEILFASEIKAILAARPELTRLDPQAIDQFLTLHYVPGPGTIYAGVKKLPPASRLRWVHGEVQLESWWELPRGTAASLDRVEADAELAARLDDAIRTRMLSDVPVGAFLSGGVDSAFLVARMQALSGARVRTFTIGFSGTPHDERLAARQTSEMLGTDHRELVVERVAAADFEGAVRAADEPLADGALTPTYLLARAAAREVKVVLTGEGADELFGGYPWYRLERRLAPLFAMPQGVRDAVRLGITHLGGAAPRVLRALGRHLGTNGAEGVARWTRVFSDEEKHDLYSPDLRSALGRTPHPYAVLGAPLAAMGAARRGRYLDARVLLPDDLLMKVDKATMAHGLEARSPYLDHLLVELASSLPERLQFDRREGKAAFRRVALGALPAPLAQRLGATRKRGFTVPTALWLGRDLRELVDEVRSDFERLPIAALFSPARFRRAIELGTADGELGAYQAWTLVNLATWARLAPVSL